MVYTPVNFNTDYLYIFNLVLIYIDVSYALNFKPNTWPKNTSFIPMRFLFYLSDFVFIRPLQSKNRICTYRVITMNSCIFVLVQ